MSASRSCATIRLPMAHYARSERRISLLRIKFKMSPLPKPRLPIRLICLDADDTLWGHESYFQASYRRFVDLLAPFADASRSEERLVEIESRNLHLYGYGVKGFTLSMLETALEIM